VEYLAAHSPVSPVIEGRALATDAPADLLSQVDELPVQMMDVLRTTWSLDDLEPLDRRLATNL
jgi:hypothetical protein